MSETAATFGVSWWTVRAAPNEACFNTLPDANRLSLPMLGIDEHRFRSPGSSATRKPVPGSDKRTTVRSRLAEFFAVDDATGKLSAV
ncbi:hypothetical protein [Pseudarthrobacter sp. MDT1-22]